MHFELKFAKMVLIDVYFMISKILHWYDQSQNNIKTDLSLVISIFRFKTNIFLSKKLIII